MNPEWRRCEHAGECGLAALPKQQEAVRDFSSGWVQIEHRSLRPGRGSMGCRSWEPSLNTTSAWLVGQALRRALQRHDAPARPAVNHPTLASARVRNRALESQSAATRGARRAIGPPERAGFRLTLLQRCATCCGTPSTFEHPPRRGLGFPLGVQRLEPCLHVGDEILSLRRGPNRAASATAASHQEQGPENDRRDRPQHVDQGTPATQPASGSMDTWDGRGAAPPAHEGGPRRQPPPRFTARAR